jgi:hypothetical protein
MFPRLLLLVVIQFGLAASALAEPSKPTGEALRLVVSGRTVLIETPIGSFPIRYKSDGTMTGQAPACAFRARRTVFPIDSGQQSDASRTVIRDKPDSIPTKPDTASHRHRL